MEPVVTARGGSAGGAGKVQATQRCVDLSPLVILIVVTGAEAVDAARGRSELAHERTPPSGTSHRRPGLQSCEREMPGRMVPLFTGFS